MSIDRAGQNVREGDLNLRLGRLFIVFSTVGPPQVNISGGKPSAFLFTIIRYDG